MNNEYIRWLMNVGEARNMLYNSLRQFSEIKVDLNECDKNLPQYHRQPGSFKQIEWKINKLMSSLDYIVEQLKFNEDNKTICSQCLCEEFFDEDEDENDCEGKTLC